MSPVDRPRIEVRNMSLAYRLARNRAGTMKEYAIRLVKRQVEYERLWALNDVSFEVRPGEVFAVVGPNGAGKSTLMKIIARVLPPTEGRVIVRGTVAPMIELGAGFNQEMTALENIVLNGTLLGRDPADMRQRAPAIAEWAGLQDFLDVPVRSYSTGMLARLGFAVATDFQPDVLVVDEVLSVGDEAFQHKSRQRIQSMIERGTSVVLVSHDMGTVESVADRAMWLDNGQVKMLDSPAEVVDAYRATVG
ncbi:MAG: ABC transporter ATP-binding protein [Actinomycetota bacterium]|nr:ABC transporter ATP-binding protein [Actinomycetota bacterium]